MSHSTPVTPVTTAVRSGLSLLGGAILPVATVALFAIDSPLSIVVALLALLVPVARAAVKVRQRRALENWRRVDMLSAAAGGAVALIWFFWAVTAS